MPGVFEPCTDGWTIWGGYGTLPLNPAFCGHRIARKLLGDGSVWILVTSDHWNATQPTRTSLVPKPLPSCDAFASDWSIPPYSGIGFFFPPSVPASKSNVRRAYPIGSPFSIAMYGVTDSCAKTLGKYCSCTSASVCLFLRPTTRRYEIIISLIEHRKVMLSHEAQCDGIVAVGHDAVLCDANFVWKC